MDIAKKLTVLVRIAKILNQNKITWAVGASLLLYFKGITNEFHDIDIMIAESDVEKVKELLSDYGTLQPENPNMQYKTKFFLEYIIEEIDFDIMAGFVVVADGVEHSFSFTKKNINETIVIDSVSIPLQSVEEWKNYYFLMGRTEKVELINRCSG